MGNTAPIMVAKGKIDYGLTNDYMFRAILQKSRKTLIGLASALLHLNPEDIKDIEMVLCQDLVQVKMRNFSPF